MAVIFREPLHRAEIESKIQISPRVKWYAVGGFAGYVSEDTRESLQGPTPAIAEAMRVAIRRLSTNLLTIYELELSLGNVAVRVDEPAGSLCSLAVRLKDPLHKAEIATRLSLASSVKWLENHDHHYPIEGGYRCEETSHAIIGPLKKTQ